LRKAAEMVFACKKCKKTFRKDMSDYDDADEYCPHCDNHYVLEVEQKQRGSGEPEYDGRVIDTSILDDRMRQNFDDLLMDDELLDL
jgi:DNA-directed RNA polymerase subunit RPC12/RpoP